MEGATVHHEGPRAYDSEGETKAMTLRQDKTEDLQSEEEEKNGGGTILHLQGHQG